MNFPFSPDRARKSREGASVQIADILPYLRAFNNAFRVVASKPNAAAFERFVTYLASNNSMSVDELVRRIEEIEPPKTKKSTGNARTVSAANAADIERYVERLQSVRFDLEEFRTLFAEIQADKSLNASARKSLAAAFIPGEPKFASGKAAMDEIESYVKNLIRSQGTLERNSKVKI